MCITAKWLWTRLFSLLRLNVFQLNWRNIIIKWQWKERKTTNVMAINIYCYYSFNAIWQAVERIVVFFFRSLSLSLLLNNNASVNMQICIFVKWERQHQIQIQMKWKLNDFYNWCKWCERIAKKPDTLTKIWDRIKKNNTLIEWPDVSFKTHLNDSFVFSVDNII